MHVQGASLHVNIIVFSLVWAVKAISTKRMNAFPCEFCHVQFRNKVELLVHIQEEHTKAKKFHSNSCPSTYTGSQKMHNNACDISIQTCFVPGCKSIDNGYGYPGKIFFSVPLDPEKREKWCRAVNRDPRSLPMTRVFCCENHFDLKNYTKDLLQLKLSGPYRLRLKDDAVPHIFPETPTEHSVKKHQESEDSFQETKLSPIAKEIKAKNVQGINTLEEPPQILSLSHLIKMPVDIQIKIEGSDPFDDEDWCIDEDVNNQNLKLQDKKLNSNGANHNLIDFGSLKNEYTIEIIDDNCALNEDNHKLDNFIIVDENEEKDNNDCLNQKQSLFRKENNCDMLEKMFQCNVCQSSFFKEEDLLQHVRVLHGTTDQRKSLTSENSIKHVKELIQVKTKDNLIIDKDVFEKFDNLKEDINYKADFVDITSSNNTLHSVTKQKHTCPICYKEYSYKSWKSHMKEVHGDESYVCTICGAGFKCERYLNRHTLYKHENGIKSYEKFVRQSCPECPKTFKNNDCLAHHIKNCHANQVECQLCFSKLKSSSYLKTHMRRVHYDDGKIHKCKICCKKFKSPRQVKIHMINKHPDTLHPCPHCIRLFCNVLQLKIHLKKCNPKNEPKPTNSVNNKGNDDDIVCKIDLTID